MRKTAPYLSLFLSDNEHKIQGGGRSPDRPLVWWWCQFLLRLYDNVAVAAVAAAGMVRLQARVGPEGVRLRRYPVRPIGGNLVAGHRSVQQVSDARVIRRVAPPPPPPLHTRHLVVAYVIFHLPTQSRFGISSFVISSEAIATYYLEDFVAVYVFFCFWLFVWLCLGRRRRHRPAKPFLVKPRFRYFKLLCTCWTGQ